MTHAPNRQAPEAMPGILALIDRQSPYFTEYSAWREKMR
jgi:hypothetical protein